MHKYELMRRIKKIEQADIVLNKHDVRVLKKASAYSISLRELKRHIRNEMTAFGSKEHVEKLEKINSQLRILVQDKEAELERSNGDWNTLMEKYFEDYENQITTMDKLHAMRRISNIYTNEKTLPDIVQGMTIHHDHWVPFRLNTNEVSREDIPEHLWSIAQESSLHRQQWEQLICSDLT